MNVSLPKGLEEFVRQQVESGMYDSCSEVHRDGLRLLKARRDQDQAKLDELRRLVAEGVDSVTDAAELLGLQKGTVSKNKTKLQALGRLKPGRKLALADTEIKPTSAT